MDPQWQQKIEQDIKEAQETALPEDDEDLQIFWHSHSTILCWHFNMFIENYNKIKCLLVCVGVYRHFVIIVAEVL